MSTKEAGVEFRGLPPPSPRVSQRRERERPRAGPHAPPLPRNEVTRNLVLQNAGLLGDAKLESDLRIYCGLAAKIGKTPMAAITFIDQNFVYMAAARGLPVSSVPRLDRGATLCAHTLLDDAPPVLVVPDTARDPRCAHIPQCAVPEDDTHTGTHAHTPSSSSAASLRVRFYAGTPLLFHGYRIGTLCVFDSEPHTNADTGRGSIENTNNQHVNRNDNKTNNSNKNNSNDNNNKNNHNSDNSNDNNVYIYDDDNSSNNTGSHCDDRNNNNNSNNNKPVWDERCRHMLLDLAAVVSRYLDERQQRLSLHTEQNCAQLMVSVVQSLKPALARVSRQRRAMEYIYEVVRGAESETQRAEYLPDLVDVCEEFRGSLRQLDHTIETSLKLGVMSVRLSPSQHRERHKQRRRSLRLFPGACFPVPAVGPPGVTGGSPGTPSRAHSFLAHNTLSLTHAHTHSTAAEIGLNLWLQELHTLQTLPSYYCPLLHDVHWTTRCSAQKCLHVSEAHTDSLGLVANLLISRALLKWKHVRVVVDLSLSPHTPLPHTPYGTESNDSNEQEIETDAFAVVRNGTISVHVLCVNALRLEELEKAHAAESRAHSHSEPPSYNPQAHTQRPSSSPAHSLSPSPPQSHTHSPAHSPPHSHTPSLSHTPSSRRRKQLQQQEEETQLSSADLSQRPTEKDLRETAEALKLYCSPEGRKELQFIQQCDLFVAKFVLQAEQGGLEHFLYRTSPAYSNKSNGVNGEQEDQVFREPEVEREMFRLWMPCKCVCTPSSLSSTTASFAMNGSVTNATGGAAPMNGVSSSLSFSRRAMSDNARALEELLSDPQWEMQSPESLSPFLAATTCKRSNIMTKMSRTQSNMYAQQRLVFQQQQQQQQRREEEERMLLNGPYETFSCLSSSVHCQRDNSSNKNNNSSNRYASNNVNNNSNSNMNISGESARGLAKTNAVSFKDSIANKTVAREKSAKRESDAQSSVPVAVSSSFLQSAWRQFTESVKAPLRQAARIAP